MKRKIDVYLGVMPFAVMALVLPTALVTRAAASDYAATASGPQTAQLQNLQSGYAPQPSVQGGSHQTLTLPQVQPQSAPGASLEIPGSQGQEESPEAPLQAPVGRQTSVGRISITATDDSGRWIDDLRKQDLAVYEDGIRRPVLGVQRDSDTPISIGIVVDTSGSMDWKLAATKAALQHFVRTLNPHDQFFLIAFSDRAFLLQDVTNNPADLTRAIGLLHAYGRTALYDAVVQGLQKVERGRWPKKALLVMTDGMDNTSSYSLGDAIQAARRAGVLIYTVGLGTTGGAAMPLAMGPAIKFGGGMLRFGGGFGGPHMGRMISDEDERVDAATLRTLSDETGATTFVMNPRVVDMSRLDAHFQSISAELREQYTVSYVSAGGDRAHQIRVEGMRPGTEVRAPKWAGDGTAEFGG